MPIVISQTAECRGLPQVAFKSKTLSQHNCIFDTKHWLIPVSRLADNFTAGLAQIAA